MCPFLFLPCEVAQDHRLTLMEVRVLMTLFSFRGKNTNTVWPSREAIRDRIGYSIHTISRTITKLKAKGWLKTTQRRGPNIYEIIVPDLDFGGSGKSAKPKAKPKPKQTVTEPVTPAATNSDRTGHPTVTEPVTPEHTNEHKRERKKVEKKEREKSEPPKAAKRATARGARLTLDAPPEKWLEWCRDKRWDLKAEDVWERFRDYWIAIPGQRGMKLDWFATWRNWVRSETPRHAANRQNGTGYKNSMQRYREARASLDRKRAAERAQTARNPYDDIWGDVHIDDRHGTDDQGVGTTVDGDFFREA